ncbi:DUF5677 domain-containing protein [Rhizobium sp. BG4]|uniref:DUF5677 domain-containing protein n=1 Tax=Rhizobium sp. BG4 TaxID=2613770 RepID=UPI00193E9E3E|nr:DUF5677 domain-containing protein [Rhizobium sp. BG4]QRM44619.1 hypothetical protein F2982_14910 [Rhizobium sp. BG4]
MDVRDEVVRILPNVKYSRTISPNLLLLSLYATIIEQIDSIIVLRQRGMSAGVDVILRAALEAYVDLKNLAADPGYRDMMMGEFHRQWIKLAEAGVKGGNPYLASFSGNEEASKRLAHHKAEAARLPSTLSVFDRFQLAGLTNEYRSIYNSLCNESHNNVRALINRHFRTGEDGQQHLSIFEDTDSNALSASLDGCNTILLGSTAIIHHHFKSECENDVNTMYRRWLDMRQIWEAEAAKSEAPAA